MNTRSIHTLRTAGTMALAGAFALSLAACQAEEPTFEADAEDLSGGELVVDSVEEDEIAVDLPETPMTPVVVEEGAEADVAAEDAAE